MIKKLLAVVVCATFLPTVANAAGGYIGGSFGQTELEVSSADKAALATAGVSLDDTDTGFKIFGGYRYNDNIAVEVFYTDLGEATVSSGANFAKIESDTLGVALMGIIPLNTNIELFAKAGFHAWDAEASSNVGLSGSDDGTDLVYGVGAAYNMQKASLRAEFERYELEEEEVDMISVGLTFNF
ncbi:MAG: outer membrane beta-barrel protein [Motiliproteus sp.]